MSSNKENEYFSDGMTEEVINALANVNGLRVASRTSAFAFKGKDVDIRHVGEKLNVGAVLEGSIRREGNRMRITAQLINVAIELKPEYPTAHHRYSLLLGSLGRLAEAQSEINRAQQLDPTSLIINAMTAWPLYYARDYRRAVRVLPIRSAILALCTFWIRSRSR